MRKKLAILLMLLIIFTSVNGVFAYTNLVEDGKITTYSNADNSFNIENTGDEEYKVPVNSYDDGDGIKYYLVTNNSDRVGTATVNYNGTEYPITEVLVGNDPSNIKITGMANGIFSPNTTLNNVTFFFDPGTYHDSIHTNYTGISDKKTNVSYVGLSGNAEDVIITRASYPAGSTAAIVDMIERYNIMTPNLYFANITFDGTNKELLPLGGSGGVGKNRGEYLFFITSNTEGLVMKNLIIQNVGTDNSTQPGGLFSPHLVRKNLAINFYRSIGQKNLEDIVIKNVKTKRGFGIVSSNQSSDIYFKNLTIDGVNAHVQSRSIKMETMNNDTTVLPITGNTLTFSGTVNLAADQYHNHIYVQNSEYKGLKVPKDWGFVAYRSPQGNNYRYNSLVYKDIPNDVIIDDYTNFDNPKIHGILDLRDNMWVVREGLNTTVQEQINYVLDVIYNRNSLMNNPKTINIPESKIKLVVKDNDIDGFDISNIDGFNVPVEIVAVKSIDDDVTRTGADVQIPVKAGATFNFALNRADTILYNFDFDTNAKYTYHQAVNGVNGTATLSDPNQVNTNIAGYPVYNTYFTGAQGAKITSVRPLTTTNFQNNRFTDLALSLTATSIVNNIFVNGNATVSGEIQTFYTGADIDAKGLGTTPDKTINYYSSDPTIATVDPTTGVVTGVSKGTVTIYAKSMDTNNEGEIEKPWAVVEINVVNKVTFKLDDTTRINFGDDTTNPKESAAGTDGSIAVPNTKLLTSQTGTNILVGWIADKDIELTDGTVINAGDLILEEQVENSKITENTIFTAVVEFKGNVEVTKKETFNKNTTQYGDTTNQTHAIVTLSENEMTVGRKMPINPIYSSEGKKYEFLGWNTRSDGSGTNFTDSTLVPESITVYAIWKVTIIPIDDKDDKPINPGISDLLLWGGGDIRPSGRLKHMAYIIGYPDGTVRPIGDITRAEVATIFFRLLDDNVRDGNLTKVNNYSDVEPTKWYNTAISTLTKLNVIKGYEDGSFKPDGKITRAELATMVTRFRQVDGHSAVMSSFQDVGDNWAARFIDIAYENQWIAGYEDGSFRPDREITRAEMATMVNRMLERGVEITQMLENMRRFSDNLPGTWYYEEIQEAANSHTYDRTGKKVPVGNYNYEIWVELIPDRDWTEYER